jgi:hypothetical protein
MTVSDPFTEALSSTLDELVACCELLAGNAQGLAGNPGLSQGLEGRRDNLKRQLVELSAGVALSQKDSAFELDLNTAFSRLEPLLQEFELVFAAYESLRRNAEAEASAPDGINLVSHKTKRTYFQMKAAAAAQPGRVA